MASRTIEVSSQCVTKIQLHAAKYLHCSINGVLLACKQQFQEEKMLHFVDAVPLFHENLHLTPMLEVALANVESYFATRELYIAGYYTASQYLSKSQEGPDIFACRVADKLKDNFGETVLVVLDNSEVPSISSLKFYERSSDGKWKPRQSEVTFESGCEDTIQDFLDGNVQRDLIDFDNHFDDTTMNWLNQHINQLIQMK